MNKISFSLTPVSTEFTGGAKVYRANVQTNGTIDQDMLATVLAERTKQDVSLWKYFLNALDEELKRQITAGYRVNIGQISTGFAIRGVFTSLDDRFDPKRHTLIATARTLDPLRSALQSVGAENVTVSLTCSVYSLMDAVTKRTNTFMGSNEVHIQGVNLGIDPENADEFVELVDADGTQVATATVTDSDAQTITCSFTEPPPAGTYTLIVHARNGNRTTLAPAVGKLKNIHVQATA